ncbi:hypothetical protein M413DRAFT_263397 [Hebeloma cylindrosporum]|uniref:Uncharacterized protein n=1 Tax=Hebeloma cylindrosporum TaxID=76867 RepID=A0A0C3CSD6_HEBCY|nr:hypothetical protein M413DRAFT_263397 [Hebeloma cylindrosporum h7]
MRTAERVPAAVLQLPTYHVCTGWTRARRPLVSRVIALAIFRQQNFTAIDHFPVAIHITSLVESGACRWVGRGYRSKLARFSGICLPGV